MLLPTEDLLGRLAIINLTHEARGLDTYEKTRNKFLKQNDKVAVSILDKNYHEEIEHVKKGVEWFKYIVAQRNLNPIEEFHRLSRLYFKGKLKEPFNR